MGVVQGRKKRRWFVVRSTSKNGQVQPYKLPQTDILISLNYSIVSVSL